MIPKNMHEYLSNQEEIVARQPCKCKVGGWEVTAIPGEAYTFGQGNVVWGPIRVSDVTPEMDVDGIAYAIPV